MISRPTLLPKLKVTLDLVDEKPLIVMCRGPDAESRDVVASLTRTGPGTVVLVGSVLLVLLGVVVSVVVVTDRGRVVVGSVEVVVDDEWDPGLDEGRPTTSPTPAVTTSATRELTATPNAMATRPRQRSSSSRRVCWRVR